MHDRQLLGLYSADNRAEGGALRVEGPRTEVIVTDCLISNSMALSPRKYGVRGYLWGLGGAIYTLNARAVEFTRCVIANSNASTAGDCEGGAIYQRESTVHLKECTIVNSSAFSSTFWAWGGAISMSYLVSPQNWPEVENILHLTGCNITNALTEPGLPARVRHHERDGVCQERRGRRNLRHLQSTLRLEGCTIAFSSAVRREGFGSTNAVGGGLGVTNYTATVIGTAFIECSADEGAGLHLLSGSVILANATRFHRNRAAVGGASYKVRTGRAIYELPAPPGHWLPNGRCEVYRESCPTVGIAPDPQCLAIFDECMMLPDTFTSTGRITPSVRGKQCTREHADPTLRLGGVARAPEQPHLPTAPGRGGPGPALSVLAWHLEVRQRRRAADLHLCWPLSAGQAVLGLRDRGAHRVRAGQVLPRGFGHRDPVPRWLVLARNQPRERLRVHLDRARLLLAGR
eukprot:597650-Prymnesium_polylepis.1